MTRKRDVGRPPSGVSCDPMRRLTPPLVLLLLALLLVATACGGATQTGGSQAPAGASIVPASAAVYVSVDSDLSSEQVEQADELLRKFPGREKLLTELRSSLAKEGVDIEKLKSSVGPEVDIVVLDLNASSQAVGLTQPRDKQEFVRLLEQGDQPAKHTTVGDWVVFSDSQAALDAFSAAQSGDKLAGKSSFIEAMDKLPAAALAKAYVDGNGVNQGLRKQFQGRVPGGIGGLDKLNWLAASLEAQSDGAAVSVVADGIEQGAAKDFSSDLVERAPQGALLFATFKADEKSFDQLTQGAGGAIIEQALGVKLSDLAQLFNGETAVWVSAGTPIPEVTVVLGGDPKRSLETLDKLAAKAALLGGGGSPTKTSVGGVPMTMVPLGPLSVYYGEVDGKVLVTDTPNAVRDFSSGGGSSLADDPTYKDAVAAAGMPESNGGFLYVNIPDAVAAFTSITSGSGNAISPEVEANLRPLRSLLAWASRDGGSTEVHAFLEIK